MTTIYEMKDSKKNKQKEKCLNSHMTSQIKCKSVYHVPRIPTQRLYGQSIRQRADNGKTNPLRACMFISFFRNFTSLIRRFSQHYFNRPLLCALHICI